MEETIFSKIIRGDIPCHKVYEDAQTCAFLDIKPINPGHTLVVPKTAYSDLFTLPSDIFLAMMRTVHLLAPVIKNALQAEGINIGMNNGKAAGQEVFHAHIHIIPRFPNDGHRHWVGHTYQEGEAQHICSIIVQTLTSTTPL